MTASSEMSISVFRLLEKNWGPCKSLFLPGKHSFQVKVYLFLLNILSKSAGVTFFFIFLMFQLNLVSFFKLFFKFIIISSFGIYVITVSLSVSTWQNSAPKHSSPSYFWELYFPFLEFNSNLVSFKVLKILYSKKSTCYIYTCFWARILSETW